VKIVRLKTKIGKREKGTLHGVAEIVPHGGNTDAAGQYLLAFGASDAYATFDQADLIEGHEAEPRGTGFTDYLTCSCGWKSNMYWDGMEYAYSEWKRHVAAAIEKENKPMFSEEQLDRYRRHRGDGGWIAVDFDGTWATYSGWTGVTEFGKPIPLMTARVKKWLEMGIEVRVMTARFVPGGYDGVTEEEFQRAMGDWTEAVCGKRLVATCTKDFNMIEQWDDRAVQIVPNTGRTLAEEHEAELSALRGAP